jgi:hypothetical protein
MGGNRIDQSRMQNKLVHTKLIMMPNKTKHIKYFIGVILILGAAMSMMRCSKSDSVGDGPGTGIGGSLNRFTIIDSFLYVLNNDRVEVYTINDGNMDFHSTTIIDSEIETIFPLDSLLLIGGERGMYICKRVSGGSIQLISSYTHIRSCDPVVTDGKFAFVTLSAGCGNFANQLDILDIQDPFNPVLLKTYQFEGPKGLGIDDDLLFLCDTPVGLMIFDRSNIFDLKLIQQFTHINPVDVIPYNGLLLVMTESSIHQFDYSDPANIIELSSFSLK